MARLFNAVSVQKNKQEWSSYFLTMPQNHVPMKKRLLFFAFSVLAIIPAHTQFFNKTVIKTRLFQDIIAFNPNLGFEKTLNTKYSVEVEFLYRNRNWDSSNSEGDFGSFYNGDGYRALMGSKMYFGKSNKRFGDPSQKAPIGWFINAQIAYSFAITYNIEKESHLGTSQYKVDSRKNWMNLNFGIGRQFFLMENLVFEFYAGPTYRSAFTEKSTITEGKDKGTVIESYADWTLSPYFSFTLGFYIE